MNVLLITFDFFPKKGGVAHTLMSLWKHFQGKENKLFIINPYTKDKNIYDILDNSNVRYKDLLIFLRKEYIKLCYHSFSKILKDKNIKLSHRINLILYLFTKPGLLIKIMENVKNIYPVIKNSDIDVIFTGDSGNALPIAFILSKLFNKKLVAMGHGMDLISKTYFSLRHFYIRNVDNLIISNEWVRRLVKKYLNFETISIVNRGVVLKESIVNESKLELRKKYNIEKDCFVILSVGRQIPRKNFNLVIEAISKIKKVHPNIKLKYFLVGDGPDTQRLKDLTGELELENQVTFLGRTSHEVRNNFYKLSDVFIMPSITKKSEIEGFGIVFLEANYFNLPVIGTASGGIVEAIVDGETGFLIKPNDLDDLIDKVLVLYTDEDKRKKMGEAGKQRVIQEYSWEKIIDDYIHVFESVIKEK